MITLTTAVELPCPTSNFAHFPEDKCENSIFLSWEKDFIALAKTKTQSMRPRRS